MELYLLRTNNVLETDIGDFGVFSPSNIILSWLSCCSTERTSEFVKIKHCLSNNLIVSSGIHHYLYLLTTRQRSSASVWLYCLPVTLNRLWERSKDPKASSSHSKYIFRPVWPKRSWIERVSSARVSLSCQGKFHRDTVYILLEVVQSNE